MANPLFDLLCPWLREKLMWIPLYLLLAFLFFKRYGNRIVWLAAAAGFTILLSDQTCNLVKHFVHRLRPCNNPELAGQIRHIVECGVGYSFMSAHSANHFGLATFICFFANGNRKLIILLYIWAASIAFSQVYVGVHYPFDVLAGAVTGIVIGLVTGSLTQKYIVPQP